MAVPYSKRENSNLDGRDVLTGFSVPLRELLDGEPST